VPSFTLVLPSPSSSLKCRSLLRSRPCCSSRALLSRRLIGRVAPTTYGIGYETHNGCLSSDLLSTTDEARASRRTTHSIRMPVESPHICNLHAGRVVSVSPWRGMSIFYLTYDDLSQRLPFQLSHWDTSTRARPFMVATTCASATPLRIPS